ncbi:MAG TPA: TIM44-like domain-containing protein [Burkholderiaceae bacterium]|nr:TIM44-like domain-containing protein [Burkholderiaceae bacterium]
MKTFWMAMVAVIAATSISIGDAEAKRMGGGRSIGKQAPSNTIQRDATPSTPASPSAAPNAPAQSAGPNAPAAPAASATAPRPGQAAAAAPARAGNRWLGPIAGIAAGLGLAALASYLGFGEELATIMLIALVAMAVLVAVRMFMARRAAAQRRPAYAGQYGFTGLGQEASVPNYQPTPVPAAASAQPMDAIRSAAQPIADGRVPAGFDTEGFLRNARVHFIRLQAAFDAGDTDDLREFTSPEMFAELKLEIDERAGAPNQTDVVSLDAALLGVDAGADEHLASVRFTGSLRERANAAPEAFDEVWNFTRPAAGQGGWVLAGIQQLTRA